MNYVKLIGGLGNQLFQYAYAFYLVKKGKKVKLEISEFNHYKLHKLTIHNFKIRLKFSKWKEVKKFYIFKNSFITYLIKIFSKKTYIFLNKIFNNCSIKYEHLNNLNLDSSNLLHDGYWQSLKFVEINKKELLKQFKAKKQSISHKKILKYISTKKNSVAIHIRLYTKVRGEDKFHGNISSNYIRKAKEKIELKIKNPFYFIFTNSNDWVFKNLKIKRSNYKIIKGFKDYEDLISIAKCKNQIISNSTFGWWGAWLNENKNKIIIVPKQWFLKKKNPVNLIPKNWIKI